MKSRKWTEEKILETLKQIIAQIGYFPTVQQLQAMKLSNLTSAIQRDNRGMYHYQVLLGHPKRKPEFYWDTRIDDELKIVIDQIGRFPTEKDLVKLGKIGIYHAIKRTNQSLNDYRRKFGFELIERDKDYWKKWENLEKEIKPLIVDNKFPSCAQIYCNIGGGCVRSVMYFGGIKKVAEKMGYKHTYFYISRDGHYLRSYNEYIFDEFLFSRGIQHEVDGIIDNKHKYRYDFKIGSLYFEIWGIDCSVNHKINKYYLKKRTIKEELYKTNGFKLVSIEHYIFERSFEEIEKYFYDLLSGLGFDVLIVKSDYSLKVINNRNMWSVEKVIDELQKIIDKIGKMPTYKYLADNYRLDLAGVIEKYGGFNYFASKLGVTCKRHNYWNVELIKKELCEIQGKIGRFPKRKELNSKLYSAIHEYGSMKLFKQAIMNPELDVEFRRRKRTSIKKKLKA